MINIAYITDNNYAMPTCVSIQSLIENTDSDEININIIADNINEEAEKAFYCFQENEKCSLNIIKADSAKYKEFSNLYALQHDIIHVSSCAIYKFEMSEILSDLDKVIYLDGDTIIQKDIAELYNYEIGDNYLAAVNDMGDEHSMDGFSRLAEKIGFFRKDYFNSGVMLLNLSKMRSDNIFEKLIDYKRNGINYFMDQDALNAVLGDGFVKLPYKYNFRAPVFDIMDIDDVNEIFYERKEYDSIEKCIADQNVLHLSDRMKPWKYNLPFFTEIFMHYYEKTLYGKCKLELLSPIKRIHDESKDLQEYMEWRFPYERISKGEKIILYGAGDVGKSLFRQVSYTGYCEIISWVDINYKKYRENIENPDVISQKEYDHVLLAVYDKKSRKEIIDYLKRNGVNERSIVLLNPL